jgi:hypothetical protein
MTKPTQIAFVIAAIIAISIQSFAIEIESSGPVECPIAPPPTGETRISLTSSVESLSGYTQYRIGGYVELATGESGVVRMPISELEFPLDVAMASIGCEISFSKNIITKLTYKESITSDAGELKDSDWGIADPESHPNRLDIYSESDAGLDARIVDLKLRGRVYKNRTETLQLFTGGRFMYQNFQFEITNLDQWYPSRPQLGHDYVSGNVLDYEVSYYIFAGEFAAQYKKEKFSVGSSVGIAVVASEDKDQHLLRSKVNESDGIGTGALFSLEGKYRITDHWAAAVQIKYISLYTEGESKACFNGSYDHTIDHEIESRQASAALEVEFTF